MDISKLSDALKSLDLSKIYDLLENTDHEYSDKDDPSEMDTIGQLVDKLITVDLKMWFNQEFLYHCRRQTKEEFVSEFQDDPGKMYESIKKCCDLNCQRNRLIDEIDQRLSDAVSGNVDPDHLMQKSHKTY